MASTTEAERKLPTAKSKLTNGATLPGVDGRSSWVRRLRDLMALHLSDLGGEAAVSEAEKSIIRRAATLTVVLERLELVFCQGRRGQCVRAGSISAHGRQPSALARKPWDREAGDRPDSIL